MYLKCKYTTEGLTLGFYNAPHPCKSVVLLFKVNWTSSYWGWGDSSIGNLLVLQTWGHGLHPCKLHTKFWAWWPCACHLSSEEVEAERALEHSGQPAWSSSSLISKPVRLPVLGRKNRQVVREWLRNNRWHRPRIYTQVYTHVHSQIITHMHINLSVIVIWIIAIFLITSFQCIFMFDYEVLYSQHVLTY